MGAEGLDPLDLLRVLGRAAVEEIEMELQVPVGRQRPPVRLQELNQSHQIEIRQCRQKDLIVRLEVDISKESLAGPGEAVNAASLQAAMELTGLTLEQIDAVTYPWHTYYFAATVGWLLVRRFPASLTLLSNRSHPTQRGQILFGHLYLARRLRRFFASKRLPPVVPIAHHDAHAASAFLTSPFEQAVVLNMDGYGDCCSTSVYLGRDNRLRCVYENRFFDSLGMLYTVLTEYLGFVGNRDEGKVMGLAPYGQSPRAQALLERLRPLFQVREGHVVNRHRLTGVLLERHLARLLRGQRFDHVAWAAQALLEELLAGWVGWHVRQTGIGRVALAGGVFLNVKANQALLALEGVQELRPLPFAGDESAAPGAAFLSWADQVGSARAWEQHQPLTTLYLGPDADQDVDEAMADAHLGGCQVHQPADTGDAVARLLAQGRIVARCAGRLEFGPRALGNRSILCPAHDRGLAERLNRQVKRRDFWMPFAPTVLQEALEDLVHNPKGAAAPWMILTLPTTPTTSSGRTTPLKSLGRITRILPVSSSISMCLFPTE